MNGLSRLVGAEGHHLVAEAADADVFLVDRGATFDVSESRRAVVLGGDGKSAAGHVPSGASAEQIDAALRAVAAGLTVGPAQGEPNGFGRLKDSDPDVLLTPRELEVLAAIRDGLSNKAIARRLDISLHTVKFHVESIFRKLKTSNRAEAVARGWELFRHTVEL
jgi:DNA-binding NarL/FixJ family response regulator